MLKIQQWIVSIFLFAVSTACFALPFNIYPVPGISLPTFVQTGQSIAAYYNVTNVAHRQLNNNYIKYLPPNVSQITADPGVPNICGSAFNLAPNGSPGDTCTLELSVSGAVNANDPDPHHHLFACLFGGVLCAGTNNPLNVIAAGALTNVVVTPTAPSIAEGQTQQFVATAVFSDGTTQDVSSLVTWTSATPAVATISNSGLASALTVGTTTITASLLGVSGSTILTVDHFTIVSGTYTTTGGLTTPILLQTSNAGQLWTYAVTSSTGNVLPTGATNYAIKSSTCSGTLCVVAGSYASGGSQIYAFQTINAGNTYTTAISGAIGPLPAGYATGALNGVSCSGANCIVVGYYNVNTATNFPYVAQTANTGTTYTAAVTATTPTLPAGYTTGVLTNATCTGSICLASGNYTTTTQLPLLVQSVPPSSAYNYVTLATPTDYGSNAALNASACNATNCVAVGQYDPTAGLGDAHLGYQSTNTGTGWVLGISSTNEPTNNNGTANLTGAACSTNACIAVGFYNAIVGGDNTQVPIVYESVAGGAFTPVVSNGVGPTLPTNFGAQLASASCSGTLCVAAGTYTNVTNLPLILVSTDGGATWAVATNPINPGATFTNLTIGSTICQGTFCSIAASYSDGTNTQPLVIQTINSGTSFTYSVFSGSPAKPTDAVNITLTTTAAAALMPALEQAAHKSFDHTQDLKNMLTHY